MRAHESITFGATTQGSSGATGVFERRRPEEATAARATTRTPARGGDRAVAGENAAARAGEASGERAAAPR
jgi:hypothetical protein